MEKFSAELETTIDLLPDYQGAPSMFSAYSSIFDAIRKLQGIRLDIQPLAEVTATKFSSSALSSRIYMLAEQTMAAGTWCHQSFTTPGYVVAYLGLAELPLQNSEPTATANYQRPLFLLRPVAAGEVAELCVSGIVYVAQTLVPGVTYKLNYQTLSTMQDETDLSFGTFDLPVGVALTAHHLLFKKLA